MAHHEHDAAMTAVPAHRQFDLRQAIGASDKRTHEFPQRHDAAHSTGGGSTGHSRMSAT